MSETETKPCGICGGVIGPDIGGGRMCYGCGPRCMRPDYAGGCLCPMCHSFGSMASAEARIYERGGYVAGDYAGVPVVADPTVLAGHARLVGGYTATVDEVSRKWEAEVSASFASRPSGPTVGLAAFLPERIEDRYPTPTPAAMLGEAASLLERARLILTTLCEGKASPGSVWLARTMATSTRAAVEAAKREAEAASLLQPSTVQARLKPASNSDAAREAWRAVVGAQLDRHRDILETCERRVSEVAERPPEGMCTSHRMFLCPTCHANPPKASAPAACWQCEAPLGTTEKCLMCEAKRAEDKAKALGKGVVFRRAGRSVPLVDVPAEDLKTWLDLTCKALQTVDLPAIRLAVEFELARRDAVETATRTEERVVGTGSTDGSGILVMGGSAPAPGSVMGTGTADETLAEFVERTEGAPHPALRLLE